MQDHDERKNRLALIASIVFVLIFALTFLGIFGR
jgi:hypothetical protein